MDHGSAHELIEDLLLDPARLATFPSSNAPRDVALREHLDGCGACRADLETWGRLQAAVTGALAADDPAAAARSVEPMEPPPSLRTRVLTAVRSAAPEPTLTPVPMATRRWGLASMSSSRRAWLGVAAALAVLVVGAGVLLDQTAKLESAQEEARGLAAAVAAVDRVLSEPQHRVVALTTPQGAAGGSISWTRHDLVVLSTTLAAPKPGEIYRCWLSSDGDGWAVGKMYFAGQTAYWVGSLDEWASFEIGPTTLFRVSLEPPGADPATRSGPIVLEAALGA